MKYLSAADILLIHSFIIDETGGAHGVRNRAAIESLIASPRQSFGGIEQYPGIYQKAGVYLLRIIMNHPFVDGNKRTGITAASVFLEDNGCKIKAAEGEIEEFALRVIEKKLKISEIAAWLEEHSTLR